MVRTRTPNGKFKGTQKIFDLKIYATRRKDGWTNFFMMKESCKIKDHFIWRRVVGEAKALASVGKRVSYTYMEEVGLGKAKLPGSVVWKVTNIYCSVLLHRFQNYNFSENDPLTRNECLNDKF